jgi:hypothetical protein
MTEKSIKNGAVVYKIESLSNPDLLYIGATENLYKRKTVHLALLRGNYHYSKALQAHVNAFGLQDIQISVMITGTIPDLTATENLCLKTFRPCFNSRLPGWRHTEETKHRMSPGAFKNLNYGCF